MVYPSDFIYGIDGFWGNPRKVKVKIKFESAFGRWLPVFLWAAVIFFFSSLAQIKVSEFFVWYFIAKKIAHILEYAILFTLILQATRKNWVLTFFVTMLYAVSDEFHQSFVPGRTSTFYDLGFDLSGANIAAYTLWKLQQIRHKKPKK